MIGKSVASPRHLSPIVAGDRSAPGAGLVGFDSACSLRATTSKAWATAATSQQKYEMLAKPNTYEKRCGRHNLSSRSHIFGCFGFYQAAGWGPVDTLRRIRPAGRRTTCRVMWSSERQRPRIENGTPAAVCAWMPRGTFGFSYRDRRRLDRPLLSPGFFFRVQTSSLQPRDPIQPRPRARRVPSPRGQGH